MWKIGPTHSLPNTPKKAIKETKHAHLLWEQKSRDHLLASLWLAPGPSALAATWVQGPQTTEREGTEHAVQPPGSTTTVGLEGQAQHQAPPRPLGTQRWSGRDTNVMRSNVSQVISQAKSRINSSFILGGKWLSKNRAWRGWGRQAGGQELHKGTGTQSREIWPGIRYDFNHLIKYLNKCARRAAQGCRSSSAHFKIYPAGTSLQLKMNTSPSSRLETSHKSGCVWGTN